MTTVRTLAESDFFTWYPLFAERDDAEAPLGDEAAVQIWRWILDPAGPLTALVAVDDGGVAIGLIHLRPVPLTATGRISLAIDDLTGTAEAADRLFGAATAHARAIGAVRVEWPGALAAVPVDGETERRDTRVLAV